jgi:hypothetical protein
LDHELYGWKSYYDTFPTVYGIPSNSIGMRRYEFFHPTTLPENCGWLNRSLQVGPESGDKITINIRYIFTFVEKPRNKSILRCA